MSQDKCSNKKHLKELEGYCKSCKIIVCQHCKIDHLSHVIMNYDIVLKEIEKECDDLEEKISEKNKERTDHEDLFKINIQDKYDSQIDLIGKHFRELHNQLHYKEVELKRELKSYHDDNLELYTSIVSELEHDIQSSKEYIKVFKNSPILTPEDTLTNYSEFKNKTTSTTTDMEEDVGNDLNRINIDETEEFTKDYQVVSLNESLLINVSNIINTMELKKRFQNILNKKRSDTIIYRYSAKGAERINIQTDETKLILNTEAPNSPPWSNNGYLYQNNSNDGFLILFGSRKYYILDTKEERPQWVTGDFTINREKTWYQPTVCDGKDYVYIVGGANNYDEANGKSGKDIYRFNINTHTFESIGELPVTSRFHSLSIHEDHIYICGQNNSRDGYLNRISRFNIKSGEIESIYSPTDSEVKAGYGIISGVYDASLNACFCMSQHFLFYRYDLATRLPTPLSPYPISASDKRPLLHCKMNLDIPNSLIYFFYLQDSTAVSDTFSVYNIKNNSWTKMTGVLSSKGGWLDYISFSNV